MYAVLSYIYKDKYLDFLLLCCLYESIEGAGDTVRAHKLAPDSLCDKYQRIMNWFNKGSVKDGRFSFNQCLSITRIREQQYLS